MHLQMVALDGVCTKDGETPRFLEVSAPSSARMQASDVDQRTGQARRGVVP